MSRRRELAPVRRPLAAALTWVRHPALQDIKNQGGHKYLAQQDIENKTTFRFGLQERAFLKTYEKIVGSHIPLNQGHQKEKCQTGSRNIPIIRMYILLPRTIHYSLAPFLMDFSNKLQEIDRFTLMLWETTLGTRREQKNRKLLERERGENSTHIDKNPHTMLRRGCFPLLGQPASCFGVYLLYELINSLLSYACTNSVS